MVSVLGVERLKSAYSLLTLVHIGSNISRSVWRKKNKQLTSLIKCCLGLVEVWSKQIGCESSEDSVYLTLIKPTGTDTTMLITYPEHYVLYFGGSTSSCNAGR